MNKYVSKLLLLVIVFLAAGSIVNGAEVIKLKAANYLPVTHPMSKLSEWFCEEVKNRTKGEVEITYFAGGTMLNPVKMYDGVVTGIVDMGLSHIQYTRGRFPVTEVFDLPLGFPSGWVATQVSYDFYNKFKPKEWNDVEVLYLSTSGPLIIQTISKPIRTLEDIKGVKIRATGQLSDVIAALGGLPIPMQMPDVYDALRRGVIEGTTVDLSTLKFWKFAEVVKYVTSMWRLGTGITFYWVVSKNKWDKLPADIQKIIRKVGDEAKEKQAVLWNDMDIQGKDFFTSKGGKMIDLSIKEVNRWKKATQPVITAYKKTMVSKGYKESEINEWLKYIDDRTKYWTRQQKTRKVASPY
ncbi:MAG: TRAP transporter substrate-binding protein [Spirochaetes bacterium]|nr:TRAP transporter substrate-binding protein [Spirochaetota bacterium]